MLQRMNAYIEHQNWCQFQKQEAKWPPHSAISFVMGADGQSCKDACWQQGKTRLLQNYFCSLLLESKVNKKKRKANFYISENRIGLTNDQVCFVADFYFYFLGLICEPSHFLQINSARSMKQAKVDCSREDYVADIFYPGYDPHSNECVFQKEELLFSCVGQKTNFRRFCPCRNYIKGQTALCQECL